MGFVSYIKERSSALLHAVARFPAVVVMLILLAAVSTANLARDESSTRLILSIVVAAYFALAAHSLLEKDGRDLLRRLLVIPASALAGAAFYWIGLMGESIERLELGEEKYLIRTLLVCLILFCLFLAIQCFRNKVVFGPVFMSVFKSFFTTLLFSGVLFGGLSLILAAVDNLLLRPDHILNEKTYSYAAIWVWMVVAPIILMSLLMTFRNDEKSIERDKKMSSCPSFFRILLLYVIIPLLMVYTLVLLIYLGKTLVTGTGQDLLRPLIISYSVAVIIVYFLISEIENRLASFFRLVFPKIMAAIALYQLVVSIMDFSKRGVDFSEYFIILTSVYAVVCGILMSIFKVQKNVLHIWVLCGIAVFALLPFVNFYDVGVSSQKSVLVNVLDRNQMVSNGEIIGSTSVSKNDRILITRAYQFLRDQDELNKIDDIVTSMQSDNFSTVFGFEPEYDFGDMNYFGEPTVLSVNLNQALPVNDSDYMVQTNYIELPEGEKINMLLSGYTHDGEAYKIYARAGEGYFNFVICDSSGADVLTAPFQEFVDELRKIDGSGKENIIPLEQMTFQYTQGDISITVYVKTIVLYPEDNTDLSLTVEPIILIDFA